MRTRILVLLMAVTTGCASTYVARPQALGAPGGYITVTRDDGVELRVRPDSVDVVQHEADGAVRLAARRRHPAAWIVGAVLLGVGATLHASGSLLALTNLTGGCSFDGPCENAHDRMLTAGAITAPIGGVIAILGAAIMGANQRPRHADEAPLRW